jgi:hypothetical protein
LSVRLGDMRAYFVVIAVSMVAACGGNANVTIPPGPDAAGPMDGGDAGAHMDVHAADAPGKDTGEPDTQGTDTGVDSGHPVDSGKDTGPITCPTVPDCSNSACKAQGYKCTPPPTTGWTIAAVDFTLEVACPPGYGTGYTMYTAPTGGPAMCTCSCSLVASPSCTSGDLEYAINSTAETTCTVDEIFAVNAGCDNYTTPTTLADYHQVLDIPGASGGECDPTEKTTLPPNGSTSDYVCPLDGSPSTTGCSGGDVCVATTSVESQCVIQVGADLICPAGYTVASEVGVSLSDTRGCTTCTCDPPTATCIDPSLVFYAAADCVGTVPTSATSIDMDGNCDATNPLTLDSYASVEYSATVSGAACGLGTVTSTGSLTLVDPHTLCCVP